MASGSVAQAIETQHVGMGQVVLADGPTRLNSVLGSCVGVAIYHPGKHLGVLAHVVLPDSNGKSASPGKFADTAIPYMFLLLRQRGVTSPAELTAKIVGGARMFGTGGPLQIGESNATAITEALKAAGVRIAAKDLGGTVGRRISLNCDSGELFIQTVGSESRTL